MTDIDMTITIPADLVAEIDKRRALAEKTTGQAVSRNEWFNNVTRWVIKEIPHQAVRADLIKAWPGMPPEALGIDK